MPEVIEYASPSPRSPKPAISLPALSFACSLLGVQAIWIGLIVYAQNTRDLPLWLGFLGFGTPVAVLILGVIAALRVPRSAPLRHHIFALLGFVLAVGWVFLILFVIAMAS